MGFPGVRWSAVRDIGAPGGGAGSEVSKPAGESTNADGRGSS